MLPDPDPQWFPLINELVRDPPWLHSIIVGYADYGIVVFAVLLLAGWWIARRRGVLTVLGAAVGAPLGALAGGDQPADRLRDPRAAPLCGAARHRGVGPAQQRSVVPV